MISNQIENLAHNYIILTNKINELKKEQSKYAVLLKDYAEKNLTKGVGKISTDLEQNVKISKTNSLSADLLLENIDKLNLNKVDSKKIEEISNKYKKFTLTRKILNINVNEETGEVSKGKDITVKLLDEIETVINIITLSEIEQKSTKSTTKLTIEKAK